MQQLAKQWLSEFGNNSTQVRVLNQELDTLENFRHKALAYLRDSPFFIPSLDSLQVCE